MAKSYNLRFWADQILTTEAGDVDEVKLVASTPNTSAATLESLGGKVCCLPVS